METSLIADLYSNRFAGEITSWKALPLICDNVVHGLTSLEILIADMCKNSFVQGSVRLESFGVEM
jgi:hypothetical protein